ncbi:MAG: HNH endonuclease [Saprospiraceae bacterium]|nr:HNH endonuclease [Saprospiraceae bacterium]
MKSKIRNALISILCFWTIFDVSSQSVNSNIQAFIYLPSAPTAQDGIIDLIISPSTGTAPCIIDAIKYVWHHHQDGESMLLVPQSLNNGAGSIGHIGGKTLLEKGKKGIFPSPSVVASKLLKNCK